MLPLWNNCAWQCYSLTMLKTILEDKEVNAIVLIGWCYKLFELEDNTETQCGFPMSASVKSACFSGYAPLFWAVLNCFGIVGMFNSKDALEYGLVVGPSWRCHSTTPCGQGVLKL